MSLLSEKEVRELYISAREVVQAGLAEVTIDAHVVEAEQHCQAYARVLGEKYVPPQRKS